MRTRSGLEGAFGPVSAPQASTRRVRIGRNRWKLGNLGGNRMKHPIGLAVLALRGSPTEDYALGKA